jgi:hypothetical protein
MISDPQGWRSDRIFRMALVGSLVLHLILGLAVTGFFGRAAQLARLHPKPKEDEVIAISSAIRIERRPKPLPPQRPARPRAALRQPQQPQVPRVAVAPAQPEPRVQPTEPPKRRRELSRPDQRVALAQHPPAVTRVAHQPARTSKLSDQQLAAIETDLAKTIAQERSRVDPLRAVPKETPAAPKHYKIQMSGSFGTLRHGEGYYYPIRGWKEGGFDYYYVSYEFTYPDGIYEKGSVPWPIRFAPGVDPFANPNIGALHNTPLPGPAAGYAPPAHMGKALRVFFPNTDFSQDDDS